MEKLPYIVEMTSKRKIQIDAEEVSGVLRTIQAGGVIKVKQGIIVGSMVVDVVLDEDRYKELSRKRAEIEKHNEFQKKYDEGKNLREFKGLAPLKDIFTETLKLK